MNDTPQYDSNFDAADQKLSTLDHDGEWTAPTYQWNAESIERLHAMPVGELISRLQILI
ncbi:hypothetical protein [Lacticaseibacillus daqingensis]|uniref:hypothetical protein n=1 Tax=Lacticaseibacillus daqingensis TaxID=2486014 RepID=UPI0013DE411C|nr:hypothetical protein [Lacticaseibacillus daqingensis]